MADRIALLCPSFSKVHGGLYQPSRFHSRLFKIISSRSYSPFPKRQFRHKKNVISRIISAAEPEDKNPVEEVVEEEFDEPENSFPLLNMFLAPEQLWNDPKSVAEPTAGLPELIPQQEEAQAEDDPFADDAPLAPPGYIPLSNEDVLPVLALLSSDESARKTGSATRALWAHSMGGRGRAAEVASWIQSRVPGGMTRLVDLMKERRRAVAGQASAGLLRNFASITDDLRAAVVAAGSMDGIHLILTTVDTRTEIRQEALGLLQILISSSPELCGPVMERQLIPRLLSIVARSQDKERELAAKCLASLVVSEHREAVAGTADLIPTLCDVVLDMDNVSRATRQESREALCQLAKVPEYRDQIVNQGLVPVPLIGAEAFSSFTPLLDSPLKQLEDTTAVRNVEDPNFVNPLVSDFGAEELLLGLQHPSKKRQLSQVEMEEREAKIRQQFLARIGYVEKPSGGVEVGEKLLLGSGASSGGSRERMTLLPWYDGIARLVLILGLPNVESAARGARAVADFAYFDEGREAIGRSGAVPFLIRLLAAENDDAVLAAALALQNLAVSVLVRKVIIKADGAIQLAALLFPGTAASPLVRESAVMALVQVLEPILDDEASEEPSCSKVTLEALRQLSRTDILSHLQEFLAVTETGHGREKAEILIEQICGIENEESEMVETP